MLTLLVAIFLFLGAAGWYILKNQHTQTVVDDPPMPPEPKPETADAKDEEKRKDTDSSSVSSKLEGSPQTAEQMQKKRADKAKLKEKLKKSKLTKEERRKKKEEEELLRLVRYGHTILTTQREEAKKFEEEQKRLKLREKRILEAKVSVEERRRLESLQKLKQKDLERRHQYDEKQRALLEEEERKKPPKPQPKPAWNISKEKEPGVVRLKDILNEEMSSETYKTEEEEEQERLLQYRRERRNYRKVLQKQEAVQLAAFNQKTQQSIRERELVEPEISTKIQTQVNVEKKKMAWADPTKSTYTASGACKISGIPTELHSALLGEKGYNAKLFKKLSVSITVPFDDTPVILQGKQEDIDIAISKISCFLKWKHFQAVAKSQTQLRTQCRDDASQLHGPQHRDNITELADKEKIHSLLVDAAYAEAKRNCILFYNQGMGPNRIDLHGLRLEDAVQLFKMRIEQIEALSTPSFNTVDIYFPTSTTGLAREITDYLKHYQFRFDNSPSNDCITAKV